MNNYLMFEKLLKCEVVPTEKVKKNIFKGKINPKFPPLAKRRLAAKKVVNSKRTDEQNEKRLKRQNKKLEALKQKMALYGVEMDFEGKLAQKTPSKSGMKSLATTPIMEIDDSDEDIKLKTPPHVKKVKSRPNSTATTPKGSRNNTPLNTKANMLKLEKRLKQSPLAKASPLAKKSPKKSKK